MSSPGRTTIAGGLLFDGVSPLLAEATIVVEGDNIVSITGPSAAEPGPACTSVTCRPSTPNSADAVSSNTMPAASR